MLPVAVALSSSDGVAMHYVLVLWMMSYFHAMGPIGRITHGVMLVCQVVAPVDVARAQTTAAPGPLARKQSCWGEGGKNTSAEPGRGVPVTMLTIQQLGTTSTNIITVEISIKFL